jgi:SAM-dependent methyltransferase
MLERARMETNDGEIEYRRSAIEDLRFDSECFDLVISSLALHYIEDFDAICRKVFAWLTDGGSFVFSVEHPIFTAHDKQEWYIGPTGERLHWPVDSYFEEGIRRTQWLADNVVKYHRTITSYVNRLIDSGFTIANLQEPGLPSSDEWRRPMFLLLSGVKKR